MTDVHLLLKRKVEAKAPLDVLDELMARCPDPECLECGQIVCPQGEPLHFHHDGCPACHAD